jgi:hypothetical protein
MTNEQIITIIISATVSAIVSSFAKPFTEKIFAVIMPDAKKVISFMKKVFFFIFRYGPTSFWIIRLFILSDLPFDKYWVLQLSINILILGIIISLDISSIFLNKHYATTEKIISLMSDQNKLIIDVSNATNRNHETLINLKNSKE